MSDSANANINENIQVNFDFAEIQGDLKKIMALCGEKIRSDIVSSMAKTPRNMNVTYYTNSKKGHNPSLPYNPPAPDTGFLRMSIRSSAESGDGFVSLTVGSTLKDAMYPIYLEFGTSKMLPRPWLKPALDRGKDEVKEAVTKFLREKFNNG